MRLATAIRLGTISLIALGLCSFQTIRAADSDDHPAKTVEKPLRIERRLVPAGRPEDWPREANQSYLPIAAEEFERRLAALDVRSSVETSTPRPASLTSGEYHAELTDGDDLRGDAVWEFELRNSPKALVPLEGCQLAIGECHWLPTPDSAEATAKDNGRRAIVGNDEHGKLFAVVDRSGKIGCSWSMHGQRDAVGNLSFALSLPASPRSTLELTVPVELTPTVEQGIVTPIDAPSSGRQKWQIELGGNHRGTLRIAKGAAPNGHTPKAFVRQAMTYELTPRGLEMSAEIKLDVLGAPLRQIRMTVEAPLSVVTARLGDVKLPITPVNPPQTMEKNKGAGDPTSNEFTIDLPEPIQGPGRLLRIAAIAPIPWDSRWRLPLVHFPDAQWQEGAAKLAVASPVVLNELLLENCRQSEVDPLSGAVHGESLGIQFFNERADIEIAVSQRLRAVRVNQGTSVELRANEGTGVLHADFSADEGESFALDADITPQWLIDNVESVPAGLVADWSQQQPTRGQSGKLTVRLRSPLSPQHDVHLVVNARRRRAPGSDTFRAADLAMLKFNDATSVRRVVGVQALDPFQLQLHGDEELSRLDPAKLSALDGSLLGENQSGLAFVDDENAQTLAVTLSAKAPQYDADIHAEVLATNDRLIESYRFLVTPSGRELRRFRIRFSQPRPEPVVWSIADDLQAALSVRRLPASETTAIDAGAGETWEAVLPTPTATPFELRASRETTLGDDTPIALASLVDADNQRGTVQVSSIARVAPEVRSRRRLTSIPVALPPADQYPTALAAFRYNPAEQGALSADAPLVLAAASSSATLPQAWIWQAQLESRLGRSGAEHVLTCRVENAGLSRIRFQPPAGAMLHAALLDGQNAIDSGVASADAWRINLRPGVRFATLVLQWSDNQSELRTISTCATPWPSCDVPIMERDWTVLLPPGLSLVESENAGVSPDLTWTNRLFGPLAPSRTDEKSMVSASVGNSKANSTQSALISPWQSQSFEQNSAGSADIGWSVHRFTNLGEMEPRIWLVDRSSIAAKSWALALLMLAARWWVGRKSIAIDLAVCGIVASLALVVPATWTPLTSAVWLGLCAGTLLSWFVPATGHRAVDRKRFVDQPSTARHVTAAVGGCLLLLLVWQAWVCAAEPRDSNAAASAETENVQHVLVPVDENHRPVGATYYMTQSLYDELLRRTAAAAPSDPQCLITAATYRADINPGSGGNGVIGSDWQCEFNVESLTDQATTHLSLGGDGSVLVPDGVQLDGLPEPFRWDETTSRLGVTLAKAGTHRLTVKVHPLLDRRGCDFVIPVCSNAHVELTHPASVPIEISSASEVREESISENRSDRAATGAVRSMASLGPVARMIVRQTALTAPAGSAPATNFEVDEFYWLHVRPGSVSVDARWKINVRSGRLQQFTLAADPRWRPLAPAGGAAVSQIHAAGNDPGVFVVELAHPAVGRATIDASFLLIGASGVGHWPQPPFEVHDATVNRRRWAVTADPALACDVPALGNDAIRPDQFATAWGSGDTKPQFAWRANQQDIAHGVNTWVREPQLAARYQMSLLAGLKETSLRLLADVAIADGQLFEYRLHVPAQLEIDQIAVRDQSAARPARWSRSQPDLVTIFLVAPTSGPRQILLSGRMATPPAGKFNLPDFQVERSKAEGFRVLLLRRADVRLDVVDSAAATLVAEGDLNTVIAEAQHSGLLEPANAMKQALVTALQLTKGFSSVSIKVSPNQPALEAIQLTTLNRAADNWQATVDLDCRLADGLVDSLRMNLPPNWTGPFEVSPPTPFSIDEIIGENRRQLVLRPERPLAAAKMPVSFHWRISGPLLAAAGQRPLAPDVHLEGDIHQTSYFLLPRQMENQQLSWDTSGLVFKPLPNELAAQVPELSFYRSYQSNGPRVRASLRSVDRSSENPQVRSVDVAYRSQNGGRTVGVAAFDLEPAGTTSCDLQLPAQTRLIQARLDSTPAQLSVSGENRWSIWLGDSKLPRHLELIFTGNSTNVADDLLEFVAPRIVDWPVERTLWTVVSPEEAGTGTVSHGAPVSALRHARGRFEAASTILDSAASFSFDESTAEVANWYAPWARRFAADRAELIEAKSSVATEQARAVDADIAAVDQEHARLARRLGIPAMNGEPRRGSVLASDGLEQFELFQSSGDVVNYASVRGAGDYLTVEYARQNQSGIVARRIAAACIALLSLAIVIATRSRRTTAISGIQTGENASPISAL